MQANFKWIFLNTGGSDGQVRYSFKFAKINPTVWKYCKENEVDNRVLTLLHDCPILPKSEIYYFYKFGEQYVYKQGISNS